ncbi:MAG: L-threonylcarbamoyladenylate synthase [Aigarchaeota archaeon]|nr:L-threonylcarbamoyladenylate synthase [Aigarchaeota archaeon]
MNVMKFGAESLRSAARVVESGGLLVYPTETIYGLGCDPFNEGAVKKVFQVKRRRKVPLPVLGSSLSDLEKTCFLNDKTKRAAQAFWPGPVSLVVRKKMALSDLVTGGFGTVAVRIPCHLAALEVLRVCGGLLVGTSANLSGQEPPASFSEVSQEIMSQVDLCIDGGRSLYGVASTVIRLRRGRPVLLRKGAIPLELLSETLKSYVNDTGR